MGFWILLTKWIKAFCVAIPALSLPSTHYIHSLQRDKEDRLSDVGFAVTSQRDGMGFLEKEGFR